MAADTCTLPRSVTDAFTLIELLVVISIIALLSAMLLVAVGLVRRGAPSANCTSNLHQIALAATAYSGENDGGMVPNYGTNPDGTNAPSYFDFLYPYIQWPRCRIGSWSSHGISPLTCVDFTI